MEMQQLRHFLVAVELGNLGRAAEKLNMTQSGLSRSIRNLENAVGMPLLKRTAHGVSLSKSGEMLLPHAEAIVNEHDRIMETMFRVRQGREGIVNIGVTVNYAHYFIPELIAEFRKLRPNVDVRLKSGDYPSMISSLQLAEIDFLFGLLSPTSDKPPIGITIEPSFVSQSSIIAPRGHRLSVQGPTAEQLSEEEWALLDGRGFRDAFTEYFVSKNLPTPRETIITNSLAFLRKAVSTMGLLTILPREIVAQELDSGELVILEAEVPAGLTHAGIAMRANSSLPPAAKQLLDHIKRKIGNANN